MSHVKFKSVEHWVINVFMNGLAVYCKENTPVILEALDNEGRPFGLYHLVANEGFLADSPEEAIHILEMKLLSEKIKEFIDSDEYAIVVEF